MPRTRRRPSSSTARPAGGRRRFVSPSRGCEASRRLIAAPHWRGSSSPGGALYAYLAAEVFAHESPAVWELVRRVAPLERFTAPLCEALGVRGVRRDPGVSRAAWAFRPASGTHRPLVLAERTVGEFALVHLAPDATETNRVLERAAAWFEEHDFTEEALRCLALAGRPEAIAPHPGGSGRQAPRPGVGRCRSQCCRAHRADASRRGRRAARGPGVPGPGQVGRGAPLLRASRPRPERVATRPRVEDGARAPPRRSARRGPRGLRPRRRDG